MSETPTAGVGRERAEGSDTTTLTSNTSTGQFGISRYNVGFKLLKQAGWEEGQGLGAASQGPINPVQAWHQAGRKGIGAPGNNGEKKRRHDAAEEGRREPGAEPACQPQKKTNLDKQVNKRIRKAAERQQALRDSALDRRMRRMFNEDDEAAQHNPLLNSNAKLSASNPLLDD